MSTLGAERVWSTEHLYAWQTAVCPLPGAKGPGQLSISASHGVPEGVRTERKYWGEGCGEEVRAGETCWGISLITLSAAFNYTTIKSAGTRAETFI